MKQNFDQLTNPPEENFYEIAEERRRTRKELSQTKENNSIVAQSERKALQKAIEELGQKASEFKIKEHKGVSGAKEFLKSQSEDAPKAGFVDEYKITKQLGNEFKLLIELDTNISTFDRAIKKNTHEAHFESDPYERKRLDRIITQQEEDKKELEQKRIEMIQKDPLIARATELVEYKKSLHQEGGIVMTPTVKEYLDQIEDKMITGRPAFLHGPTGTGKTSLGRRSSEELTGQRAEVIFCNEQTREADLYGRMGIDVKDNASFTKFIAGKLTRAVQDGKPIIFDEFNRLTTDQQAMIKGLFGFRPGQMVPIAGNGEVKMQEGFQIIATANLKSDKHADRTDLPDEMKREFRQNHLEIGYNPVHESYDIMLARLMNADGSIDLSWYDLNTTLPKLAEAMESIQRAYGGELSEDDARAIGEMNASNVKAQLTSFVMTQGSISDMLSQWPLAKRNGTSFAEFIDQKLVSELSFGKDEVAKRDHQMAAKIFALKGLLKSVSPTDLGLPADTFNGVKIKESRGDKSTIDDMKEQSSKITHISLKELAQLDPFNVREKFNPLDEFEIEGISGDEFLKNLKSEILDLRGIESSNPSISHHYQYLNPQTSQVEHQEDIHIDIEQSIKFFTNLYQQTNIDLPPNFESIIQEIWNTNYNTIQEAIKEHGFNALLIALPTPLTELSEKMSMEKGYYEWITSNSIVKTLDNIPLSSTGTDKPRLLLYHATQNLKDRPELKNTLGIKAQDITLEESFSLEDYIIASRTYFEQTSKHLDEDSYTWTPRTTSGAHFVYAGWGPSGSTLIVCSLDAGYSHSLLGCRPLRSFY